MKFILKDPDGEKILEQKPDETIEQNDGGTMNFVFVFKPFEVKKLGQYSICLYLDDREYENKF